MAQKISEVNSDEWTSRKHRKEAPGRLHKRSGVNERNIKGGIKKVGGTRKSERWNSFASAEKIDE